MSGFLYSVPTLIQACLICFETLIASYHAMRFVISVISILLVLATPTAIAFDTDAELFYDVPLTHPAYEAINALVDAGILSG